MHHGRAGVDERIRKVKAMSKLKIEPLALAGVCLVTSNSFADQRGLFTRLFCQNELSQILGHRQIVNVNLSSTIKKGMVRGLHFQNPPAAEMKMVRCLRGAVYDVVVDIRKDSPTFLKWLGVELTEKNMQMLVIPEGFAHGFQTLEDDSHFLYFTTAFYSQPDEDALNAQDPALNIHWPIRISGISEKDGSHPMISQRFFPGINAETLGSSE